MNPSYGSRLVERNGLVLGEPFEGGPASVFVAPGVTADGREVVLKVQDPHRESEHEAEALQVWDGEGAVRLLDHEPEEHALLLERCVPGTPLSAAGAEAALDVFVGLLPRLWKPAAASFRTLAAEAAWWADSLEDTWERFGRPFERKLLDAALEGLQELPKAQGPAVLLHQDLHGDNVLAAQREPWLAIDPKPLAGEREFGIAPIVRSRELGHSRREVLDRFDRLTSDLGLDRERARGWTIGQTIAWAFDGEHQRGHAEVARWLLEAG
ncbi:MAG: aminoglycoside phosphotransferase family protein [Gaiellaceae bacterium]